MLQPRGQTFQLTESIFLRLLGLVYLLSFASFWPQIVGLAGENGVAPAAEVLSAIRADYGWRAYLDVPSVFWFHKADATLLLICVLGCVAGLLLMSGLFVRTSALSAYLLYLSIVSIGQPFTSFQWDALLLESGFLAIFAGSSLLPLAYRFLLFRLMFESGFVKLTSGDQNWRNFHALRYHLFTQPLPTPLAYFVHFAPPWLLDTLTVLTVFIELVVPLFLFAYPRRVRQVAVALLVALQICIALTGNYAFFNLLSVALCVWALDDSCFRRLEKWRMPEWARFAKATNLAIALVILLSVLQIFGLEPSFIQPFEIVNPYGLFAVMTTSRTELVIEGSNDNVNWKPYNFRFKPGDVRRALPVVAPYQPRLDWQMWFAALGRPEGNRWTQMLVYRLLLGQREVLNLLESAPFSKPPHAIRIQAYDYTFATPQERARDGVVWRRSLLWTWLGPMSLDSN